MSIWPGGHVAVAAHSFLKAKEIKTFFPKTPQINPPYPMMKAKDKPYFADTLPFLLLSRPSLSELNRLLEKEGVDLEVEERRFRPNIFIDGPFNAFAEDKWPWVKIGDVVFRHSQLCDRCDFTQVDPAVGDKHRGGEPLKTLRKYRCTKDPEEKKVFGSSPFFGVNISVEEAGEVHVGDKVADMLTS